MRGGRTAAVGTGCRRSLVDATAPAGPTVPDAAASPAQVENRRADQLAGRGVHGGRRGRGPAGSRGPLRGPSRRPGSRRRCPAGSSSPPTAETGGRLRLRFYDELGLRVGARLRLGRDPADRLGRLDGDGLGPLDGIRLCLAAAVRGVTRTRRTGRVAGPAVLVGLGTTGGAADRRRPRGRAAVFPAGILERGDERLDVRSARSVRGRPRTSTRLSPSAYRRRCGAGAGEAVTT